MRRTGLNFVYAQRHRAQPASTDVAEWEFQVPRGFVLEQVQEDYQRELRVDVRNAVRALPLIFRETVLLRCLLGYSVKEIAEMLDIAPGTVKSRYARGRRILHQRLSRTGYAKY